MDLGNACSGLHPDALIELQSIVELHEDASSLVTDIVNFIGSKAEKIKSKLPENWQDRIDDIAEAALTKAYDLASNSQGVDDSKTLVSQVLIWANGEYWHRVAAGITGVLGGLGGAGTTLLDLPITTTLILRSIQQIAVEHGEDVKSPEVRAQCVAVFGMGGPTSSDDGSETGLWAIRVAVNGEMIAGALKMALPRFGVMVSEKALAQATPLLGAAAGGIINPVFMQFYQAMAHVHFRLRKLEKENDQDQLRACFDRLVQIRRENLKRARMQARRNKGRGQMPD